jgi:hypothetical protein
MKKKDYALSEVHGELLMVAVVLVLFLIIFSLIMGYINLNSFTNRLAPPLIKIISINNEGNKLEGQITIRSFANEEINNSDLQAVLYVNDKKILACIHTLHGYDFIPTHHYGVKNIGGSGCREDFFSPGESITIDLKNGYIRPGDVVELRIYRISSDNYMPPFQGSLLDKEYTDEYLSEYVYGSLKGYRLYSQHKYTA